MCFAANVMSLRACSRTLSRHTRRWASVALIVPLARGADTAMECPNCHSPDHNQVLWGPRSILATTANALLYLIQIGSVVYLSSGFALHRKCLTCGYKFLGPRRNAQLRRVHPVRVQPQGQRLRSMFRMRMETAPEVSCVQTQGRCWIETTTLESP